MGRERQRPVDPRSIGDEPLDECVVLKIPIDRPIVDVIRPSPYLVADFVWNAAMRDQMFPRKPIEKERPRRLEKPEDEDQAPPSGM